MRRRLRLRRPYRRLRSVRPTGDVEQIWPKLLRAYAIDACVPAKGTRSAATTLKAGCGHGEGEGRNVQIAGHGRRRTLGRTAVVGAGLLVEDQPVHLEVFANS